MRYFCIFIASTLTLLAETLWKSLWPVAYLMLAYTMLLLFNIPQSLGDTGHLIVSLVFATTLLATSIYCLRRFRFPRRRDIEAHIEAQNKTAHQPIRTSYDTPATALSEDTQELWERHILNAKRQMSRLRLYRPNFTITAEHDIYALRYIVIILLVVSATMAGHTWEQRLTEGAAPKMAFTSFDPTLDVWVDPPKYIDTAAVFLHSASQGSVNETLTATKGSVLKIRSTGYRLTPKVSYHGKELALEEPSRNNFTLDIPLLESGTLTFKTFLQTEKQWTLRVVDDTPPSIELVNISASPTSATKIAYVVQDDHKIKTLRGTVAAHEDTLDQLGDTEYTFEVPPLASDNGREQRHLIDLTSHVWAGKKVNITLHAVDSFDQEVTSKSLSYTLPERRFHNPTSRRLAAERKKLIWAQGEDIYLEVAEAVSQIAIQPQLYKGDIVSFMALNSAVNRLAFHPNKNTKEEVVDLLWSIAVELEDGGLLMAQKDLYNALQEMQSALASADQINAEELQRILQEVQLQMQKYMQAMAQEMAMRMRQGQHMPKVSASLMDKLSKKINMQNILEQMQKLQEARTAEELRDMAEQLKRSIENFSLGGSDESHQKQMQAMESLQDIEDIITDQEALLDKTNKTKDKEHLGLLALDQDGLLNRLAVALTKLAGSLGNIPDNFANAYMAMEQSYEALSDGFAQTASIHQQKALEELKKGEEKSLEAIANAMQQSMVTFNFMPQGQNYGKDYDPLGRRMNTEETKLPNQSELRRIQKIMDELRKRSNDYRRSQKEREYIERLIY